MFKAAASMTSCQTTRMPPPIGESRRSIAAVQQVSVDDLPAGLQLLLDHVANPTTLLVRLV